MLSSMIFGAEARYGTKDAESWLDVAESWGGGKSQSGVVVSKRQAIGYSNVWRAVSLIAGDVAKVPLMVYRRTNDGRGKTRANEHPAYRLMRWRPNSEQNALSFREQVQADALIHGNGYAFIERLGNGTPHELRWLDPTRTYPERTNGKLGYVRHTEAGNKLPPIPPENVFHLKGLCDDGLAGYSVLSVARETFGLGIAARDFGSRFFGNNSITPLVFETDHILTDAQRKDLAKSWERQQGGSKQHKTAVLPRGVRPKSIAIPADDAQLLETRAFSVREIANFFGVPPHKLGDTTRTSFASLEQENQAYLQEALDRWLCKWEFECWMKLLTVPQQQRDTHFFEFERKSLIRMDSRTRASYNRTALGGGPWETTNEVRAKENLDPIDDPKADELQWPMNMGDNPDAGKQDDPSNEGGEGEPDPAPDQDQPKDEKTIDAGIVLSRDAVRAILVRDCGRVAGRITIAATKMAKKPKAYCGWLESFADDHREQVKGMVDDPVALARESTGNAIVRPADTLLIKAREFLDKATEATVDGLPDAVARACNDYTAWAKQWAEEQVA